ncbi:MAG: PQQ-dependent dehydrogenase, methanol/ethanol family [Bryobacteraceae bacterium]|nr:PQQ-dependent dehydrogenase, methanol/ethanol family [Bryobacteraceae bacterium]
MPLILLLLSLPLCAQVTYERLLNAAAEPRNWLTYSGSYMSQRYSQLAQVTGANAANLELKWVYQAQSLDKFETTPLVVDGVMYLTQPPNDVVALDARTGRVFWTYEYNPSPRADPCCGRVNRGLAILGDTLFMGTIDAHLLAIDAKSGRLKWDVTVFDFAQGYSLMHAPLVVKDKVIVGTAGGEFGIRGFLAAYSADTGKEVWRFHTIPGPGEPGHETWGGDSWKRGGASVWVTGSYDPVLNLTYWGIGNPGPDWNPDVRPGDNLYSDSVVALNPDTGKLKWHFQFTPHDEWDWDAVQVPVLADLTWQGPPRKVMLWGNRNAFFYVLDRETGKFLFGKPFARQTWAKGLDADGRPVKIPGMGPSAEGTLVYPGVQGATNWYSPSYSPRTGLFYLSVWDNYSSIYHKFHTDYVPGKRYLGGSPRSVVSPTRRESVKLWSEEAGYGAVRAIDPHTGDVKWEFKTADVSDSGLLSTASDLLFSGSREGWFYAFDARDGRVLWKKYLGGQTIAGPMTYEVAGRQYITVASGHSLFTFGLRGD